MTVQFATSGDVSTMRTEIRKFIGNSLKKNGVDVREMSVAEQQKRYAQATHKILTNMVKEKPAGIQVVCDEHAFLGLHYMTTGKMQSRLKTSE